MQNTDINAHLVRQKDNSNEAGKLEITNRGKLSISMYSIAM
jgi:hypothetical protein